MVYHHDHLIAVAPFYLQKPKKWYQPTILYPLGQGEPEISEIASEYNDILIAPSYEDVVLTGLSKKLKSLKIDQVNWRATFPESNISKLLKQTYNFQSTANHAQYIIERANWSLDTLSKNTRSRYKRSLNQLKKTNTTFCWVDTKHYEKFTNILTQYHQNRWQEKGNNGAFSQQNFCNFHKNVRKERKGKLVKMSAIIIDECPIAINYYLVDDKTLYFYQCGWDEGNYAKLSPGLALHIWSIEHCEHQYYDFMMGSINDSYKTKFMCQKLPMTNIQVNLSPNKIMLNKTLQKFGLK